MTAKNYRLCRIRETIDRAGLRLSSFALLLGLLLADAACARNVALLIAVGKFQDPALWEHQLLGPADDIDSVQKMLTEHWAFAANDVHALRDAQATRERILAEIAALEQRSAPGDRLLIYFSGHGTSAYEGNNGYDLPYATGAWIPFDFDESTKASIQRTLIIGHRDLLPRLKRLDDTGRFVLVVSDSCYSGQVVRSFGRPRGRSRYLRMIPRDLGVARATPSPPAAAPSARPPPEPYPYQHVVLLSGASDSEEGNDIATPEMLAQAPTVDGTAHGAFTDAFLRLLDGRLLPGTFTYAQGREAMSTFLELRNFPQHPQLLPALAEDPQNLGSSPFLGAAQGGSASAGSVVAPARNKLVRVKFEAVSPALQAKIAGLGGVSIVNQDADITVRERGATVQLLGPAGDPILDTRRDDPSLIRRIAAQAWMNRALPPATDQLGLRAETDPGSRGNTFVECESFVFEVSLQRAGYVMLLDLDSQGNLKVLYPTNAAERRSVGSGAPRAIPGSDPNDHIIATKPFGTDAVTVLAFEKLPDFFSALNGADAFAADSTFADQLAKGFARATGPISVRQMNVNIYAGDGKATCGH